MVFHPLAALQDQCLIIAMWRTIFLYGLSFAGLALVLAWANYQHAFFGLPNEFYVLFIALIFTALGLWIGAKLTTKIPAQDFSRNEKAMQYLGISSRECEVLELLSQGHSNKIIARKLGISPNTVKTHLAKLFEKLEAENRTQATNKARALQILP